MYKPNSNRGDHYGGSGGRSNDDYQKRSANGGGGYSYNGSSGRGGNRGGSNNGTRDFSSVNTQRRINPNQHEEINLNKPVWNSQNMKPFEKEFFRETSASKNRPQAVYSHFLAENNVTLAGGAMIKPVLEFDECDLPDTILNKFREAKYSKPTAIQSMCWPTLMSGNDLVGIAQTGSGKTLGFIIPILIHISNNQRYMRSISSNRDDTPGPVALVLAPTRELAIQIQAVAEEFGCYTGIRNICIYGGASKGPQAQSIRKGAEIYIGTPGRLLDFLKEGTISLNRCTYLVLDEADRMLDMGFEPQIRKLIEQIRPDRQTAMFSATWPKEVRKLAEDFLTTYIQISIGNANELQANPNIKQIVEVCEEPQKEIRLKEILCDIMRYRDSKVIIFAETKKKVDYYSKFIRDLGYHCLTIHGDKKQQEREWVLGDIEDIKYVINVDYPVQTEDYIHRIGRTARSTNLGTAYTFITSDNSRHLPKLVDVLRESNQQISDSVMNLLARTGGRMNANRNFARGGYQNNANNCNTQFSMGNGNTQRQSYNQPQGYGQSNGNRDYSNGSIGLRKRENSYDDNGRSNVESNRAFKRSKWDDGPSVSNQPAQLMANSRPSPPTSSSYSNGLSTNRNTMSYGPYPVSNGAQTPIAKSVPPPPPPASSKTSNGVQPVQPPMPPQGYQADYSSMYNLQYYQAIAAAAASNGGAGWQAAAYSNWPAATAATSTAK